MEIKGESIILRDYIEADIEDDIYWETVETEWQLWDAPWEYEEGEFFDSDKYCKKMLETLNSQKDKNRIRRKFEICIDNEKKTHIGGCNSYNIDSNYKYTKGHGKCTIGIDICSVNARGKGYATSALKLFIYYLMSNGFNEFYTQTWSGNYRMIGLAEKLGFEECNREDNIRIVRGSYYDGLTFRLNIEKFINNHPLIQANNGSSFSYRTKSLKAIAGVVIKSKFI
ncbi:GNAT family protein [uncultured Clostridium sp.]|uniref:GNAT family N-acetyltransferase n=1 Tax=uncultured Clostridium sp. TaxID=59620 RepID=UPI003216D808